MTAYNKPTTTYEEQIEILKKRNLIINNEKYAEEMLRNIGYFRLSGYWLGFYQSKDYFNDGTTFEHVVNVHDFDCRLRNLLIGLFEEIEIRFTTRIAHEFATYYSPIDHYNKECFEREDWFNRWLEEFENSVKKAGVRKELYVKHYDEKYEGIFPVWTALEMSSFGAISKFYNNLTLDLKKIISRRTIGLSQVYLQNWLYALSVTRNMCAHNSRLYDRTLNISPRLPKGTDIDAKSIFAVIFVSKRMICNKDHWDEFVEKLDDLVGSRKVGVNLNMLGFPLNWKELLIGK